MSNRQCDKISRSKLTYQKIEMDSQENQIVENQLHRSVLLDHEMVVDGVVLRERKELNNVADDEGNQQKSVLIHTRFIGDKKYEVQQVAVGDDIVEENVATDLSDEDIGKFKEEWEEKWKPSIGQNNGGFVNFFKNLLSLN